MRNLVFLQAIHKHALSNKTFVILCTLLNLFVYSCLQNRSLNWKRIQSLDFEMSKYITSIERSSTI